MQQRLPPGKYCHVPWNADFVSACGLRLVIEICVGSMPFVPSLSSCSHCQQDLLEASCSFSVLICVDPPLPGFYHEDCVSWLNFDRPWA